MTRIGLIVYIKDPKEASGVNYIYIEDTEVKETTKADIATTTYPVRSDTISIINLNISQVSI
jgi:predicted transcriptional regulator